VTDEVEQGKVIEQLWWKVLGEPDTPDDAQEGFVSLGGYSLAAARFIGAVRDELGIEVPLQLLLGENARLADVRALAAEHQPAPGAASVLPAGERRIAPRTESALAPGQRRIWLLSKLHPESWAYNVIAALRLRGPLSVDALRAALSDVVARHDALRAGVVEDGDARPRLRYVSQSEPELIIKNLGQPLSDEAVATFVRAAGRHLITMETAPLLRAELLRAEGDGPPDACLVIAVHHLVSDQRSVDIILQDLATAYGSRLNGERPAFAPAPSFGDYADAETASRDDSRWTGDLAYWRDLLGGSPGSGALPFSRRTAPVPSFQGADHNLRIAGQEAAAVDSYAQKNGVTPAVMLLGCVAVVLGRWLGSDRVIVGVPSSRRRTGMQQDLVGFLVDTLPIAADVGTSAHLSSLLRHLRDRYVAAVSHSAPPFDAIVEALDLPPRPLASPLFQTWFNDLTQGAAAPFMRGLEVTAVPTPGAAALFDLNFYLHRDPRGYRLQLVRAVHQVREDVAEELLNQCRAVLAHLLSDDAADPVSVPIITPRATAAWQRSTTPMAPRRPTAPALVTPESDALALITPAGQLTRGEFGRLIDTLSVELTHAGVTPGAVVEIDAQRAGGLPLALLACWRLGAAAGLVDATSPAAWQARCRQLLRPSKILVVSADTPAGAVIEQGTVPPRSLPGAGHILFTSGSSGPQLAVAAPLESVDAALAWYSQSFAPGPADRVAMLAGLGHDPLLRDILVPIRFGGTLIVPTPDIFSDPRMLLDLLAGQRITILHATPALLELVLAAHAASPELHLGDLRLVISAGAPLTAGLARRLRALTAAAIVNGYGTTETPQIAACHLVARRGESLDGHLADLPDEAPLPIGQGVAGAQLVVQNRDGRLAGVGQVGEILVRGTRLATGYLGSEGMDGRFAADPWGDPEARVFRTGDLGRLGPDGLLYFSGRMDRQLSVDGFRVEPAEIEAAARRLPAVAQAVAGMTNTAAGLVLALQVVAVPGAGLTPADVRAHLRTQLALHAVPGVIRVVPRLTTNTNHKVVLEESASPAAARLDEAAGRRSGGTGAAPASSSELLDWLTRMLRDVTDSDIAPDRNFFEAGLTSMTLLHLHARMASVLPAPPPATVLFTYPTLRSLARFLSDGVESTRPTRRRRAPEAGRDTQRHRARGQRTEAGSLLHA
jgi:non-ribosomal peptide synthetase component F/acyl carrier protein